ncbi:hypothetical protein ACEN2S_10565 [Phaeovulum sp. W22_SRMD_FR3]
MARKTQYSQGFPGQGRWEIVPETPPFPGTIAAILCICEHVRHFENFAACFSGGRLGRYVTSAASFDFSGETMGLAGEVGLLPD